MQFGKPFASLADAVAQNSGKPEAFFVVFLLTTAWLIAGPIYGWSDAWQLVANTVTNVVTFIMVFVIQNSQNRDSAALQAKLYRSQIELNRTQLDAGPRIAVPACYQFKSNWNWYNNAQHRLAQDWNFAFGEFFGALSSHSTFSAD